VVARFAPFHDARAEQGHGRLENVGVVAQSPAAGTNVAAGTSVALKLDTPVFHGPIGSLAVPTSTLTTRRFLGPSV
jgi:hypothetical protein